MEEITYFEPPFQIEFENNLNKYTALVWRGQEGDKIIYEVKWQNFTDEKDNGIIHKLERITMHYQKIKWFYLDKASYGEDFLNSIGTAILAYDKADNS